MSFSPRLRGIICLTVTLVLSIGTWMPGMHAGAIAVIPMTGLVTGLMCLLFYGARRLLTRRAAPDPLCGRRAPCITCPDEQIHGSTRMLRYTWLGHAGLRLEIGDQVLLIDPWEPGNPMFPADRRAEMFAGATAILITTRA